MTRLILSFALLAGLVACGVDGAPTRPDPGPETGVTISGQVSVGIQGNL
ncbi:MAG: hypothetical protein ACJAXT_000016 [Paracoccaceae bacterium]|jgi:hypothetical protein